jgi:VCBS repeat protein/ASPIC/UnbV protein/tetratricopeptide repeat protein
MNPAVRGSPLRGLSRFIRRGVLVASLLVAIAAGLGSFFFWRLVQTTRALGLSSGVGTLTYAFSLIRDMYECHDEDQFRARIRELERSTEGVTGYSADRQRLAQLYFFSGDFDRSEPLYRELLKLEPNNPELLEHLALLLMRRAELNNCAAMRRACIYPLPQAHGDPEAAAEAYALFESATHASDRWSLRWMQHISRMAKGDPVTPFDFVSRASTERRVEIVPKLHEGARDAGVDKTGNGRGVVVGDFDGDGLLDIIATGTWGPMSYYHNRGDRTFEDRSSASGLSKFLSCFILIAGDIDNDGDLDIYCSGHAFYGQAKNFMLENDGRGHFTDVTEKSGTSNGGAGFVGAFADYDNDGDLDLFVANFSNPFRLERWWPQELFGKHSNVLYRNRGDGTFEDVTREAGLECIDAHVGATWGDVDNDGDPDLYVTTNPGHNHLYINRGDGTFQDVAAERGVTEPWTALSGCFLDYDLDGSLDLVVPAQARTEAVARYLVTGEAPDLEISMRLFHNDGKGRFEDVTERAGLRLAAGGLSINSGDINGDGYPDLFLGTGGPPLERLEPDLLFVNRGDGTFWNATFETGTGHLQKGHGISFADLDGDGRQELYVVLGGAWPVDQWSNVLYWNHTGEDSRRPHFIKVVLRGKRSNSHGVGARVSVTAGGRTILREISQGGGFGANPYLAEVGLGLVERIDRVEVAWPTSKTKQVFENVPIDKTILVEELAGEPQILDPSICAPGIEDRR